MSILVQPEVRAHNFSYPVVVTLKFVPVQGGHAEPRLVEFINALVSRLSDGIEVVENVYRLDEISYHGNEARVLFA